MKKFKITDNTSGKQFIVNWQEDREPSQADIELIQKSIPSQSTPKVRGYENLKEFMPQKLEPKKIAANIIPSTVGLGKALAQPVIHPIETAKAVGNLALGTAQQAIPGEQGKEQYANALGDALLNRYGTLDNVKKTINTDPAGFAMDVSTILTGLGGAATKATQLPKVAKAGAIAEKAGTLASPVGLPMTVAKETAGKIKLLPDVEASLIKALKPAAKNYQFKAALNEAIPIIKEASIKNNVPINNLDDMINMTKLSKSAVWDKYEQILNQAQKADPKKYNIYIDGDAISKAMLENIDARFIKQNPKQYANIVEKAETYKGTKLTPREAEEYIQSANNELSSYYGKNPMAKRHDRKDPEVGFTVREAEALRKAQYDKLNKLTGKDALTLKKQYGALNNIEEAAINRANVAARQQPYSLSEQLNLPQAAAAGVAGGMFGGIPGALAGAGYGATQSLVTKGLKKLGSTDYLIKSAFQKYGKKPANITPGISKTAGLGYLLGNVNELGLPRK